jgi:CHASE2 domain-containing sensor protein
VTDYGVDPRGTGIPYLVMEHLVGVTLDRALQWGPMSLENGLPVLSAIASAIDFAHEHRILHRDIKPENVFLSQRGDAPPVVKVLDFGVAHIGGPPDIARPDHSLQMAIVNHPVATLDTIGSVDEETTRAGSADDGSAMQPPSVFMTTPGEMLGTLPYLAPELLAGDSASRASDVYAFGVLAYQMLVGRRPHNMQNRESAGYEPPPTAHSINQALSSDISRVLAWPLARYASDRPPSARAFVDALRRARYESLVQAWRRTELPRRRRLSAVIALILCAAAWQADRRAWGDTWEGRMIDARFHVAPARTPDPRIVVVLIDDSSLVESPNLLGERADEFAERFEQMFAAGASGIAVDLLLPQRWSDSQRFSRLVLTRAHQLALAAMSGPAGEIVGPECVAGLTAAALGPQRASSLFGFVNVEPDADGVTRRARLSFTDTTGARRDSFAVRSIRAGLGDSTLATASLTRQWAETVQDTFLIDTTTDRGRLNILSWSGVRDELKKSSSIFANRLVLVGASFVGSGDLHRLSGQGLISGVLVQALIANTVLKGLPIRGVRVVVWLPFLFLATWMAAAQMVRPVPFKVLTRTLWAAAFWAIGAFASFLAAGWVVPILVPAATILAAGLAAAMIRPFCRPYPQAEALMI